MSKKIGENLKELRHTIGASRADLASMIGCSEDAVRKWERGQNDPGRICRGLITAFIMELGKGDVASK